MELTSAQSTTTSTSSLHPAVSACCQEGRRRRQQQQSRDKWNSALYSITAAISSAVVVPAAAASHHHHRGRTSKQITTQSPLLQLCSNSKHTRSPSVKTSNCQCGSSSSGSSFLANIMTNPHVIQRRQFNGLSFPIILIIIITLLLLPLHSTAQEEEQGGVMRANGTSTTRHQCYVCLPPDKSSHEAREILSMFGSSNIPDCAAFGPHNAHQFEFTCPDKYVGCLRRALTTNPSLVSRTCVNLAIDDCKVANSVEYCYCSGDLCNGEKPTRPIMSSAEKRDEDLENRGYWKEGITDDEDLLGPNSNNNHPEGSGDGGAPESEQSSNDNSRNPLKPANNNNNNDNDSSSQEVNQFKRKYYSGSNIPASSNKGSIRHTEQSDDHEGNNGQVKSNSPQLRAYFIVVNFLSISTLAMLFHTPCQS